MREMQLNEGGVTYVGSRDTQLLTRPGISTAPCPTSPTQTGQRGSGSAAAVLAESQGLWETPALQLKWKASRSEEVVLASL